MGGKQKTEKTIIERFFFEGRAQSARVRNKHFTIMKDYYNHFKI